MPRTKVQRKKPEKKTKEKSKDYETLLNRYTCLKSEVLIKIDEQLNKCLEEYQNLSYQRMIGIPPKVLSKTLGEVRNGASFSTTFDSTMAHQTMSTVKKPKTLRRSASFVDDEGYLTAENSTNSGGRASRRVSKQNKTTARVSRSLSRSKLQKPAPTSFKTPVNKIKPASYGTVTPKVKPNTPQILLRRPKQGEMALSLQGSPLLTSVVASERTANINIPLEDGRLLSLQPERGLRMSQIPELDPETRRQLETLRDNLNKVCGYTNRF